MRRPRWTRLGRHTARPTPLPDQRVPAATGAVVADADVATGHVVRTLPPAPGLPPTLRDPDAEERLVETGWVVIDDLVSADDLRHLRATFDELHPGPRSTWESDFYDPDASVKQRVQEEIGAAFAPGVNRHFVDHRSFLHNFVANWPGPDGGLVLHQHSSIVDPAHFRSVIVWCAVSETTIANGTLAVVPRSHRVQVGPRPERTVSWHDDHTPDLLDRFTLSVELQPGQALVFDNQLLHVSQSNSTDEPRVNAVAIVLPTAADPLYFEVDGAEVVARRVDADFFLSTPAGDLEWARPDGLPEHGRRPWAPTVVPSADLGAVLGETA